MRQSFKQILVYGFLGFNLFTPLAESSVYIENYARAEANGVVESSSTVIQNGIKREAKKALEVRAVILGGVVKEITGTILTVEKDGRTYTVLTDGQTKFRRRFWGKSSLEEMAVNNTVNIHGKWNNTDKTEIKAQLIRNLSVQKRFGVFFGEVKSKTETTLVIKTLGRGEQTVTVSADTNLVNRKMETIALAEIAIGHRIRVKGLWDSSNSTITEVIQIKDFSVPQKGID